MSSEPTPAASDTTKQRRGKTTKNSNSASVKVEVQEQVARAEAAVRSNQENVDKVHTQWRFYLLSFGYIVTMLTFHQSQNPITFCVKEIKAMNKLREDRNLTLYTGWDAMNMVFHDTQMEFLCLICGILLIVFLQGQQEAFQSQLFTNNRWYMSATIFVPMIANMYFFQKGAHGKSCIPHEDYLDLDHEDAIKDDDEWPSHGFPIILIYHVIVSASLYFMQSQQTQVAQNINAVEKMKKDLKDAQTKKKR